MPACLDDPLAGAEPDRLTRKDGEDTFVLRWQVGHMVLKQSSGLLLPSPAPQHLVKRPWASVCSVSCICRLSRQMPILNAQRPALYCAFGTGMVDFDPRKEISVQLKGLTVSLTPKPCSCTLGGFTSKTCTPGVYTFCGLSMVSLAVKFQPNRQVSMVACTQHYQHQGLLLSACMGTSCVKKKRWALAQLTKQVMSSCLLASMNHTTCAASAASRLA